MTKRSDITFTRPTREVPCDCADGPCGWVHTANTGPSRYFIDGEEVSWEAAKHAYHVQRPDITCTCKEDA